ncbi:type II toxin-antitoxin system VapB family antitoxin [Pantoea sp.]|uniref:type II toxin-antitoxin system VapB family antitoxin n=1 Tax=Pantoea sp. TaxID=69393 RepID=UPI0031E00AFB
MSRGTVFTSNRTQNVRIPADVRFPDDVKNVFVRAVGNERILVPIENAWDSFFLDGPTVSEDFMDERASQEQTEREDF